MSSPIDIRAERAARSNDPMTTSVEDTLRRALGDVVKGEEGSFPSRVVIIVQYSDRGGLAHEISYRANLTRIEELGLLELHKYELIERWKAE